MANFSITLGYPQRNTAKTTGPALLYLGKDFQEAKAKMWALADGINYAEAWRVNGLQVTRKHYDRPPGEPGDILDPEEPELFRAGAAEEAVEEPAEGASKKRARS